jgi:MoaA/NifB/PqqE/SkfB family radical SAM enzyme
MNIKQKLYNIKKFNKKIKELEIEIINLQFDRPIYRLGKNIKKETDQSDKIDKLVRIKLWEKKRLERTIKNLLPLLSEQ